MPAWRGVKAAGGLAAVSVGYLVAAGVAVRVAGVSPDSPWFVGVAAICFLGWMAAARPLFLPRLPGWARTIRPWEGPRGPYRLLGVTAFGTLLRRSPLRFLNLAVYSTRPRRDAAGLAAQLEAAETSHLLDGILVLPYMAHVGLQRQWGVFAAFTILQLAANVYPILHLRVARGRVARAAGRSRSDR